jgi:hypothetical protein
MLEQFVGNTVRTCSEAVFQVVSVCLDWKNVYAQFVARSNADDLGID